MTLNFYTLSVIYLVYSFLGWVAETVAATIRGGRFANRGAAAGPFCFIYGTTGGLLAVSFGDLRTEPVYLFFACMMAATVMEWITAKLLELDFTPTAENVHLIDMCGPGYTIPSPEGNAAIRMMAENDGLFLDPVYTGKAFAGLVKMAREGQFKPTDNVLYLYSGGAGGLFAIDVALG